MPILASFADVVRDWQGLLDAVRDNADILPNVEPHRAALEAALAEAREIKARQIAHAGGRQGATQELKTRVTRGRELAIALRGAIKADLGPKSERLGQFGVAPIRRRTRRAKENGEPAETPPPTLPPAPTPPPAAAVKPPA